MDWAAAATVANAWTGGLVARAEHRSLQRTSSLQQVSSSEPKASLTAAVVPRCITLEQAAAYCSLSASAYKRWAKERLVPGFLPGTQRIDRKKLELALDRLSGISAQAPQDASDAEAWFRSRSQP